MSGLLKRAFWVLVCLLAIAGAASHLVSWTSPPPQPTALSPAQLRSQQVRQAVNRGEAALITHIRAKLHDPASFELVDTRAIDAGDHITMVMTYRGRNGFNAVRTERVAATLDLQGNITSVQEIE